MNETVAKLGGGDLRSEGRAAEVAAEVVRQPALLADLARGLDSDDKLIRARTCMAIEVVSRDHANLVEPVVPKLADLASRESVPQARWHLAETFARVCLSDEDAERVVSALLGYLTDKSKIVRYCAVETLGVVGGRSVQRDRIIDRIREMTGVSKSLDKSVARAVRRLSDDES